MEEAKGAMRINKFLSAMGFCSRREADRLVEAGKVTVDGVKAELGTLVEPGMKVKVDGETVGTAEDVSARKTVLIAVNKPRGVVCTTSDNDRAENIVEMVEYPERIYPIGRLDKDSEGLMLMTNRGDLVDRILRGSNGHEKEYLVKVDKALTEKFVDHMRCGVHLGELQVTTRPCKIVIKDKTSFYITLTQGLNRQIRRMCEALDYHVISLKRIRVMNIRLGNLKTGTWRNVTPEELKTLESMLKKSGEEALKKEKNSPAGTKRKKHSAEKTADHTGKGAENGR
ncbi:MAG: pseudouridine synthase [Stomatobaculum sp.]|nr:pseudouridine synthase [Stomatobaculum sp.]